MQKRKPSKFDQSPKGAAYRAEWIRQNCDRYELIMPKGRKQIIADAAAAAGLPMSRYILAAIEEYMEHHPAASENNKEE